MQNMMAVRSICINQESCCVGFCPRSNLLFSKNKPEDEYLYNKQEFELKMNELQSSIEKLNETISNKEKQGCETADVKKLEEKE